MIVEDKRRDLNILCLRCCLFVDDGGVVDSWTRGGAKGKSKSGS